VFGTVTGFFVQVRRARRADRLLRTAYVLYADGRLPEAAAALREVRELAERPGTSRFLAGAQLVTRLRAVTLASLVAAKLGERHTALGAIDEGLRLYGSLEHRLRPGRTAQALKEWETWAREYARSGPGAWWEAPG
jgi:hypothetical protein